ncbi:MAG: hypothetical protein SFY92_11115 [Verrucomicrobiae bacterium]|nr:hypothetical protein [Verrucomicrobiae bacterium]
MFDTQDLTIRKTELRLRMEMQREELGVCLRETRELLAPVGTLWNLFRGGTPLLRFGNLGLLGVLAKLLLGAMRGSPENPAEKNTARDLFNMSRPLLMAGGGWLLQWALKRLFR